MSDHFAIFHIAGNMSTVKLTQPVSPKLTRDMQKKNVTKFLNEMMLNVHIAHSIKCYLVYTINVFLFENITNLTIVRNLG